MLQLDMPETLLELDQELTSIQAESAHFQLAQIYRKQGRPCADLSIANDASPFDVRQV